MKQHFCALPIFVALIGCSSRPESIDQWQGKSSRFRVGALNIEYFASDAGLGGVPRDVWL